MQTSSSRLAPFIREYIYDKKWQSIKEIQEDAIKVILDTDSHVLIAAGTAAGKTEACFFPILTLIEKESKSYTGGINVLYIGPLKALINDQFERLSPLLERAEIPLWRWHGDVAQGHKHKLLENPGGILQITPESLEALLLRQPQKIKLLFNDLKFAIIDEVHAFLGEDRGAQLICLLERIKGISGCDPRRVGLSATLGDYSSALEWLKAGSDRNTVIISEGIDSNTAKKLPRRKISLAVDFYKDSRFYPALYDQCQGDSGVPFRKCIIFTNSRVEAEETTANLKAIARERNEEDHYHVHHGSIAASLRAEAEQKLKESGAQTIAATATLELGIDIGQLDRIIQIGAPMGVSSFVQRLGRSGRRSGVSQMYFSSREYPENAFNILGNIPWELLKTIAVIQLYLEERWIEDSRPKPLPFSLLCHQTFSVLASLGEHSFGDLSNQLLALPPFRGIGEEDYATLLRYLITNGFIDVIEGGKLIIGLEGERIVNHYSFYSVFPDEEEFRVCFGGREIGKVNFIPPEGSGLVLAGKSWKVTYVNLKSREINVSPGSGEVSKIWQGGLGNVHLRIARRMKQALLEKVRYPYLSASAAERMNEARQYAEAMNIRNTDFIPISEDDSSHNFILLPWLGSRGMRTLYLALQKQIYRKDLGITFIERKNEYALSISSKLGIDMFEEILLGIINTVKNPEEMLDSARIPYTDKYDYLLPPELLLKQYAANMLDLEEAGLITGHT
ncbi:DEAD/DEAH box helicase [Leadbettera azotonutricia]|uniref:ATP-dependent helicase n=1 Tax=Leadbettera azotonutricia (strain ATCC BAA-888 / DSM 13862 / ZAS-9) TaxID=545695 RepID=F5YG54_LEAAZ|nr:DEAD/DEAH box helicase [Leadbettera azotonutricia]AEF81438.1 ATP-dependent helicase [Leadbettera azotonutricia ZAS-9]